MARHSIPKAWSGTCDTIVGRRNGMARLPLTEEQVSSTKVVLKLGKVGLTDEQFWQLCRDNGDL